MNHKRKINGLNAANLTKLESMARKIANFVYDQDGRLTVGARQNPLGSVKR